MSEKVKVPQLISTYIEDLLLVTTKESFLAGILGNANSPKYVAIRNYFDGMFDDLLIALVNGWEPEQTPEDKVRERYQSHRATDDYGNAYRQAVRDTLNALNIQIEGVNT